MKRSAKVNVGNLERLGSLAAGAVLSLYGLKRRHAFGLLMAGIGTALMKRGLSGHCEVYDRTGLNTARASRW